MIIYYYFYLFPEMYYNMSQILLYIYIVTKFGVVRFFKVFDILSNIVKYDVLYVNIL